MSPALHAVARLIECSPAREGLAAELSEALVDEMRVPFATRLRLVALAARLESGEHCECASSGRGPPEWVSSLAAAFLRDEASALEALVENAPRLRAAVAGAGSNACRLPAMALLELLERRMH